MSEAETTIPVARRERKDISNAFMWGAVGVVGGLLVAMVVLAAVLFPQARTDKSIREPLPTYPSPPLQTNDEADMRALRAAAMAQLYGFGWIDQAHGVAHIPIDQAMRDVARDGIQGWPTAPERAR